MRRAALANSGSCLLSLSALQGAAARPATALEHEKVFQEIVDWESLHLGHEASSEDELNWVLVSIFDE